MGMISTVLFIICCLSFIKSSVRNKQEEFYIDPEIKGQKTATERVQIELFYNTDLLYVYTPDSLSKEIRATSVKTGLVIGHDWKPAFTRLYLKNGELQYISSGMHEWQFLGLTLHTMPVEFEGTIKMK